MLETLEIDTGKEQSVTKRDQTAAEPQAQGLLLDWI